MQRLSQAAVLGGALLVSVASLGAQSPAPRGLAVEQGHFTLDGKPFRIISGSMQYPRIPRAYWRERLRMAKAMGLNAVTVYVFWNVHERTPGKYDFSGQDDVAQFVRDAQAAGLYVILRPGPYVCAEWDFGGLPAWLLRDPTTVVRSLDPKFMGPAVRWLHRLGRELAPLQYTHGGPIIAVQVENEYGSFGHDHAYMEAIKRALIQAGFGDSLLYTADGADEIANGSLAELPAAINFGEGEAQGEFAKLRKLRPQGPFLNGEYWAGWFDHWGEHHHTGNLRQELADITWMLRQGYSLSIYMFNGGTSFGWMNGANRTRGDYQPDVTSYDYDAPLDESGRPTAKYFAFRDAIAKATGVTPPPVPSTPPTQAIGEVALPQAASLWDNLPAPVASHDLKTMEELGQAYGYILYRTRLPAAGGELVIDGVHDYAQVYVAGRFAGTLDRRLNQSKLAIDGRAGARLDILVENTGRVNFGPQLRGERQGIVGSVSLGGVRLTGWKIYPLPLDRVENFRFAREPCRKAPCFYRGRFDAPKSGSMAADTFLDTAGWTKGFVWLNGRSLGRHWNIGPERTLYVPGVWLRPRGNDVVVLDLAGVARPRVDFVAKPLRSAALDTAPARSALQRLLPRWQAQITLVALDRRGADRFRISGSAGHVVVAGTSPAVLLTGVETYLEDVAHVSIGWPGNSLSRLPAVLPAPPAAIERRALVPDRYALNDVDDSYSDAYLGWPAWEHKIDELALHGINEVFIPIGTEEVYRRTFRDFGFSDRQIRGWIPAPTYQPWWLLANMSSFRANMSPHLFAGRVALAKKIVARLQALGMTPVFPGYLGMVPADFARLYPGTQVVPQGKWNDLERPGWLDPRDPMYARIAAAFYRQQRGLFGDTTMYKMDPLHEGGNAGGVPLGEAAHRIMAALQTAHPGARWVLLGWQRNPLPAVIDAVDHTHVLIVDGISDRYDGLDREQRWDGAPYAFGTIPNMGGHDTLGANAGVWRKRFSAWRGKRDSRVTGIAWMPEGSGLDPAAFARFTALAWESPPADSMPWFAAYAVSRYGGEDPHAIAAWRILGKTAYAMPSDEWAEPQDSLFDAQPSLDAHSAATWSPPSMRYQGRPFGEALCQMLRVSPALRHTTAYRYDLVDIARQALSNQARVLLPQLRAAYEARDAHRFRALASRWMSDMRLLDRLLASDPHFLLGRWVAPARTAAADPAEAVRLEYDQRLIITAWGNREASQGGGLHDYANRQWSGLVSGLYAPRWRSYFASLEQALADGAAPKPIDWFAMDQAWAQTRTAEATAARGNPWSLATKVAGRLGMCTAGRQARERDRPGGPGAIIRR